MSDITTVPFDYIVKHTKTENSSEKPNNSTTDCMRCKDFWNCDGQCDEQTERSE